MAKSLKDVAAFLVGGYDVGGAVVPSKLAAESVLASIRVCGAVYPKVLDVGSTGELEAAGWIDSPTTDVLALLHSGAQVVSVLVDGNNYGNACWMYEAVQVNRLEAGASPEELDTLTPGFTVAGSVHNGIVVAPLAVRTAAGNTDSTYADLYAASATGGTGLLHVTGLTLGAATSATINIRHSVDHITFVNWATFANVTTVGAQVIKSAVALNRYLSVSWAWNGSAGTSIQFFTGVAID